MRFRRPSLDQKALFLSLVLMAALSVYRTYNYWVTGFFVSDEFGYFYNAAHGTVYAERWFFGWMNILLFKLLGMQTVDYFSYFLPIYLFAWSGGTLFVFYKMMKLLDLDQRTISISLVSSFVLVSFVLLRLGFLTESVGLFTAMLGVYYLVRMLKVRDENGMLLSSIYAALSFTAAAGSREPYDAFLIGGAILVAFIAIKRVGSLELRRYRKYTFVAFTIAFFVVPAVMFSPISSSTTGQIGPISVGFVRSFITNAPTTVTTVTPITTSYTSTITSTYIVTSTSTSGTDVYTQTITRTTVTSSVITTTEVPAAPFYGKSVPLNTLAIFLGGIALGWGPIAFLVGLVGFIMLFMRSLKLKDITYGSLFFLTLIALGSYLIVSYIFAPDPYYFSFRNYSTIIRFSDTALPAYFLTAPLALSVIARKRAWAVALVVTLVVFVLLAVPAYQVFASSNINYSGGNPFEFGYRSPAAQIRDYISTHETDQPFYILGAPYGWVFTPGVEDLAVEVYSPTPNPLVPGISFDQFVKNHWTTFYVYTGSDPSSIAQQPQLVRQFIQTNSSSIDTSSLYTVVDRQIVIQGPGYDFIKVQLSWNQTATS